MGLRDCFSLINRRWIVTAASSMVFGGILSPMTVYGLLFVDIEAEIGMNAVQTGWIASVTWAMCFFASPISETLEKYISYRSLVVVGSCLTALFIFASSFMDSFLGLLIFYGFGHGVATNFVMHAVMCVIFSCFPSRQRILASGIAYAGSSLATVLLIITYEKLVPVIGWRLVLRLTSLFTAVVAIPASFVVSEPNARRTPINDVIKIPVNDEISETDTNRSSDSDSTEDVRLRDASWMDMLTSPILWLLFFAIVLPTMTWSVYWINIVSYFESISVTRACLNTLLTVQPIFELIGKVGIGFIAECVPHCTLLIIHNLVFVVVTIFITYVPIYSVLLLCSILIGTGRGMYNFLPYSVSTYALPDHGNDKAITVTMVAYGVGFTVGTIPAGAIYDTTGSYTYAFVLNAGWCLMGAILLLCVQRVRSSRNEGTANVGMVT